MLVALVIVAGIAAAGFRYSIPVLIGVLAGVNLATILLYGYDKAVSGGRRTRVPEKVLHLLAFLGGSPAAALSQTLFRHKTVKPAFRRLFWLIVVVQLALLAGGIWWWTRHPSWRPTL
jgi:uncharacterized membrane protein YsdA (DUF1294 family)